MQMPAKGEIAPSLMLVAVRANAPVCGNPFIRTMMMLTMPCPHSSLFGEKGVPLLLAKRSAMREQSNDSMAATNTIIQTIVDERFRGRVMSFYTMAFFGTTPIDRMIDKACGRDEVIAQRFIDWCLEQFGTPEQVFGDEADE